MNLRKAIIQGNTALTGVMGTFIAAYIGLSGVFYQQYTATKISDQERQETQVQTYFDDMGALLLDTDRPLRKAESGDDVSVLAQAKTLSVLEVLDPEHKRDVVQFLYDAQLVQTESPVISLSSAELFDADLSYTFLFDANLSEANLIGANLSTSGLSGANLSGAYLTDANLSGAYLDEADLTNAHGLTDSQLAEATSLEGTTMPDGSQHD
jgi:hypothetical protein